MTLRADLDAALARITEHGASPRLGLVLGSGLGDFVELLHDRRGFPFEDIPGMAPPSVSGHAGKLCLGTLAGERIACLQGRSHLYEGHEAAQVTYGVQLLAELGVEVVLLTNAAGGFGDGFRAGDLMLITDHINMTGHNPLVGPPPMQGQRFCDMTQAYDPRLGELARSAADELGIALHEGTYVGVLGPSYETPAEIRMLRALGAQAVGMSTVLETIALRQRGVRVAGVSLITNLAAGLSGAPLSHAEVEATARQAQKQFAALMARWCELILNDAG